MEHKQKPIFIAEVKTLSPFGWRASKSWQELLEIANMHGDWISVHTNPRWGGSFRLLNHACSHTNKPVVAKGMHEDDKEVLRGFAAGAKYVLVVGRIPKIADVFRDGLLIEPRSLAELATIPHDMKVVWNSRDLETGGFKTETFNQARAIFPGWMCQASNIKLPNDVHSTADAVLVGEAMPEFAQAWRLRYAQ